MNAKQFQESIRHLLCMNPKEFGEVFGEEMGAHLWVKFRETYQGDAGKFLCYLDLGNMAELFKHFKAHCRKCDVK